MRTTLHWSIDIYFTIERTATGIITAIDGTVDSCLVTVKVDDCLVHVACHVDTRYLIDDGIVLIVLCFYLFYVTIGSTKDLITVEGRTGRYVNHCTTGDTLLITAAIDSIELSTRQIDDGRCLMSRSCSIGYCLVNTHADTTALTTTKDLSGLIILHFIGDVDKDVAAVLQQVLFLLGEVSLSCAIDLTDIGIDTVTCRRTEVDEGIIHPWFGVALVSTGRTHICCSSTLTACFLCMEIGIIQLTGIVVHTIAASVDFLRASLYILDIGRSRQHFRIMHLADGVISTIGGSTHTTRKVFTT